MTTSEMRDDVEHGTDGECFLCHKQTHQMSARPSEWPNFFCYSSGNGKWRRYCTQCVINALALATPSVASPPSEEFAKGRLFEFQRMKKERPIDPCYWDKHEEREIRDALAAAPVGEPGRTLLPTYLQKNAPYRQCSKCGRKSWSDGEVGTICSMLQPDNSHCNGIMQLPPAAPPAQGAPTPEILAKWMIQHSFSTGHGESVQDLLNELSWQVRELRSGGESDKPGVKS